MSPSSDVVIAARLPERPRDRQRRELAGELEHRQHVLVTRRLVLTHCDVERAGTLAAKAVDLVAAHAAQLRANGWDS